MRLDREAEYSASTAAAWSGLQFFWSQRAAAYSKQQAGKEDVHVAIDLAVEPVATEIFHGGRVNP
jgi:hypothetical protein